MKFAKSKAEFLLFYFLEQPSKKKFVNLLAKAAAHILFYQFTQARFENPKSFQSLRDNSS